jgi:hypothetical protein
MIDSFSCRPGWAMLREQAFTLTTLAPSFDIQAIQGRLLDVAARCEELANRMEEEHR